MRLNSRTYQLSKVSIEDIVGHSRSNAQQPIIHFVIASSIASNNNNNNVDNVTFDARTAPSVGPIAPEPTTDSSNSRMSLKEFLRNKASRGDGVEFHEGDPDLIRIPWIHASKKNWKGSQHGKIFIEWAKNTGKPTGDVKKCKANFRCALNSLRDVREEPQLSRKNGNDGYRVFRISTERPRPSKNVRVSKARKATFESSQNPGTSLFESPPVSPDDNNNIDYECFGSEMSDFSLFASDYGIECDLAEFTRIRVEEPKKIVEPYKIPLPVANMEVDDDDEDVERKQKKSRSRSRRN